MLSLSSKQPYILMMLGWERKFWIFTSLINWSIISYYLRIDFSITFKAQMKFVCFYLCLRNYLPHQIDLPVFGFSKVAQLLKTLQADRPQLFQWEIQIKRLRLRHPLSPTLALLQISTVSQSFLELQLLWILLVLLDYFV